MGPDQTDRCLKCGMLRHPPDPFCDTAVPLEKILRLYNEGLTLTAIGRDCGISRQAISERLRKAGIDPGARRALAKQVQEREAEQRRQAREAKEAQRHRDQAFRLTILKGLADELDVSVQTLAQYASSSGRYGRSSYRREDSRTRLPHRLSPEGQALASDINEIASPWHVRHLVQYADRQVRA